MSSTTMWLHVAALPAACMLDLFLGDPSTWPHPIRWMGKAISQAEPFFRRLLYQPSCWSVEFSSIYTPDDQTFMVTFRLANIGMPFGFDLGGAGL